MNADQKTFQPMNINFGLLPPLPGKVSKKDRGRHYAQRALEALKEWKKNFIMPLSQSNTL
jgi:methylenetetrahydrofolate--tRNA-(uracil-5-)-methyltransferase